MDYIGRAEWGAQYAAGQGARPLPLAEAYAHHTYTSTLPVDATWLQEQRAMRALERIGQQRFGAGISYNLVIFPSGRCYVGTGVRRIGTHTGGRNTRALGIALAGTFTDAEPPLTQQQALVGVLQDAWRLGWLEKDTWCGGHRDVRPTTCPGSLYDLLPGLNAAAALRHNLLDPTPPGAGRTRGPDMVLVKEPDGPRVFLCGPKQAEHVDLPERDLMVAAGVPYLGDTHSPEGRRSALARRGVEGL